MSFMNKTHQASALSIDKNQNFHFNEEETFIFLIILLILIILQCFPNLLGAFNNKKNYKKIKSILKDNQSRMHQDLV